MIKVEDQASGITLAFPVPESEAMANSNNDIRTVWNNFVLRLFQIQISVGKFHDQGDAKWIVIRGQLWGHNDMPCGRPTPSRPIGCPGSGRPQGVVGVFRRKVAPL
jgi:hypothetical protein